MINQYNQMPDPILQLREKLRKQDPIIDADYHDDIPDMHTQYITHLMQYKLPVLCAPHDVSADSLEEIYRYNSLANAYNEMLYAGQVDLAEAKRMHRQYIHDHLHISAMVRALLEFFSRSVLTHEHVWQLLHKGWLDLAPDRWVACVDTYVRYQESVIWATQRNAHATAAHAVQGYLRSRDIMLDQASTAATHTQRIQALINAYEYEIFADSKMEENGWIDYDQSAAIARQRLYLCALHSARQKTQSEIALYRHEIAVLHGAIRNTDREIILSLATCLSADGRAHMRALITARRADKASLGNRIAAAQDRAEAARKLHTAIDCAKTNINRTKHGGLRDHAYDDLDLEGR